jgi:hypothetical protein
MKTAVSIPDATFANAERHAQRRKLSRSQLYALALQEYLARHDQDNLTERINAVCDAIDTAPDPLITRLNLLSLDASDDWSANHQDDWS